MWERIVFLASQPRPSSQDVGAQHLQSFETFYVHAHSMRNSTVTKFCMVTKVDERIFLQA